MGCTLTLGSAPPPPEHDTTARDAVADGLDRANDYAKEAFQDANSFLGTMQVAAVNLTSGYVAVNPDLGTIDTAITGYRAPSVPAVPANFGVSVMPVPSEPTLTSISVPTFGNAPEFTAQSPVVDLAIAPPAALTATVPLAPTLPAVIIPAAPDVVLPDVPNLLGINVPVTPLLNLPAFVVVKPDSPLAADYIFSFAESTYTSSLLTDLRARLLEWANGASTGLAPAVEQAIWDRGRSRENTLTGRKIKESIRAYASRGFTKPPGALSLEISDALQTTQDALSGLSRDVMIKQADLEQSNRRFAFEQAWRVEEGLITYQSQIAQRAFDTAKYAQQVGIDIYHENVLRYSADIQAYVAQVEVYKATIQAELTKLEIYKAQLEGQKLIGELNLQTIEIYKARIEGVKTIIDIFKAEVDAANTAALVNKTQIEGFAAQVGAYAETVRAKAAEYEGYATRVRAEVSKVEVFKAQSDAYSSQVGGFKALVDAQVAAKTLEVKIGQEVPLELFKARTEVYRTQVGAESERVGAVAKIYGTEIQGYSAQVQGETARVGSEVEIVKSDVATAVAQGNLRVEAAKVDVQMITNQSTLLIEAIKAGAQVSAQLAAAALSSVNLSAQLGDHQSISDGYSQSSSYGISTSSNSNMNCDEPKEITQFIHNISG